MAHPGRPASATVRIRDHGERINPTPLADEAKAGPVEAYLGADTLRDLAETDNLGEVTYLELQVNTTEHSLGQFGTLVPNLAKLKLSNSVLASVRDLGTRLDSLQVVWMSRCGLQDLDGISSLSSLQELYVAFNDIREVRPLTMLDSLQVLDLEGNAIDDPSQIEFLGLCSNLSTLTLEGNPICFSDNPKNPAGWQYRQETLKALPSLEVLDDVRRADSPNAGAVSSEAGVVKRAIKLRTDEEDAAIQERPGTAAVRRPGSAITRPGSVSRVGAARPSSARRPMSARPQTARPETALQRLSPDGGDYTDGSSELTQGSDVMFCGSPLKALMARRGGPARPSGLANGSTDPSDEVPPLTSDETLDLLLEHVGLLDAEDEDEAGALSDHFEDEESREDILNDLKAWRQQYAEFTEQLSTAIPETIPEGDGLEDEGDGFEFEDASSVGGSDGGAAPEVLVLEDASPAAQPRPAPPQRQQSQRRRRRPAPPQAAAATNSAGGAGQRRLPCPPSRTLPTPPRGAPGARQFRRPHTASGLRQTRKQPAPPADTRPHSGPVRPLPKIPRSRAQPRPAPPGQPAAAPLSLRRAKLGRIRPSTALPSRELDATPTALPLEH